MNFDDRSNAAYAVLFFGLVAWVIFRTGYQIGREHLQEDLQKNFEVVETRESNLHYQCSLSDIDDVESGWPRN